MGILNRLLQTCEVYPSTLYHYTTTNGLLGIVEKRNIWATSFFYLNDTQESLIGIGFVQAAIKDRLTHSTNIDESKFLKQVDQHLHVVYQFPSGIACFSAEGDLLSQWRAYASGQNGVCLGFRSNDLALLGPDEGFMLIPCIYDEDQQRDMVNEMVAEQVSLFKEEVQEASVSHQEQLLDTRTQHCLVEISFAAAAFKHHSFREEKEWRMVSQPLNAPYPGYQLRFRSCPRGLIPFVEFKLESDQVSFPLEMVTVAPSPEPVQAELAIEAFLSSQSVQSCKVVRSNCTYRSW